jgi:peptide/nickel transport system permease protein
MTRYLARRALHAVPVLFAISLVAFLLVHLVPGDPIRVMLGERATQDAVASLRAQFGLDQPLPLQYLQFVANAVRLDFGVSIALHSPVRDIILERLGPTFIVVVYATAMSFVLVFPLAIISAVKADRPPDHVIRVVMMAAFAMPAFWVGLMLVMVFSLGLGLFPTSGLGEGFLPLMVSLTLPALTLAFHLAPMQTRTLRASVIENLNADHVVAARARGLSEPRILMRHVVRNSLIATVTMIGVNLGFLLGGAVVVETVFAIPGLGSLLVNAVAARDFPVIEAVTMVFGFAVVLISLGIDLVHAALDPRIRL